MEPLAYMNLPLLEHLELRVQNVAGFGNQQLEPLAKACVPRLKYETHFPCQSTIIISPHSSIDVLLLIMSF